MLLTFTWDAPIGIDLGVYFVRYYQLFFLIAFIAGFRIMTQIFRREQVDEKYLDTLLVVMIVATILGARLGHVFFYSWDYYQNNIAEIFMPWKGGLASHGAAIAIPLSILWFYRRYGRKEMGKSFLWLMDRIIITVALAGCLIRLGNFANSEIYGVAANSSVETVYLQPARQHIDRYYSAYIDDLKFEPNGQVDTGGCDVTLYGYTMTIIPSQEIAAMSHDEADYNMNRLVSNSLRPTLNDLDEDQRNVVIAEDAALRPIEVQGQRAYELNVLGIPRHPSQIYEASAYLLIFLIVGWLYLRGYGSREGLMFGVFLIGVFGFRFFIEFLKADQEAFEANMSLNMGQWLSIPLVLIGMWLIIRSIKSNTPS